MTYDVSKSMREGDAAKWRVFIDVFADALRWLHKTTLTSGLKKGERLYSGIGGFKEEQR